MMKMIYLNGKKIMRLGFDLTKIIENFSSLHCKENTYKEILFGDQKIIPRVAASVEYFAPHLYTYKVNTHGFRSIEFSSDTNILTAGCSFTFGTSIPFEYTWSQQLQKMIPNKKVATIAWPGMSIEVIISYIFKYFKNIGNPEMIICNFPDFYRFLFLEKSSKKLIPNYTMIKNSSNLSREEKKLIEKSMYHPLWGFYVNFEHILMLEQYCESNRIKLIWSTWSKSDTVMFKDDFEFFNDIDSFYKNLNITKNFEILKNTFKYFYHNYEDSYFDCLYESNSCDKDGNIFLLKNPNVDYSDFDYLFNCHEELKKETKDFFYLAYDRYILPEKHIDNYEEHICIDDLEKNKNLNKTFDGFQGGGHWGSHRNAHVAEFYYNIIKEQYPDFI